MSQENEVPLIKKDISMLNDKMERIEQKQDEEARKNEKHRQEDYEFRAQLLEKLDSRFAGKWTEKVLVFIWSAIWIALIGSILSLVIIK